MHRGLPQRNAARDGAIHCKASEGEYGVYDLMPADVRRDCLARADTLQTGREPRSRIAAALIIAVWLVVLGLVAGVILRAVRAP